MSSYSEKLKDPRWKAKALEIVRANFGICFECGDRPAYPEVHHRWYEQDKDPWEYPDACYAVFCHACHEHAEALKKEMKREIFSLTFTSQECLLQFLRTHTQWHLQDVLAITDRTVARQGAIRCISSALEVAP